MRLGKCRSAIQSLMPCLCLLLLAGCAPPWNATPTVSATPTPQYAGGEPVLPQLQRLYHNAPALTGNLSVADFSWSLAGHDAANTSASLAAPLIGSTRWFFQTNGPVMASPIIVGELVLVNGGDGILYAVNRKTGMMQWRAALGDTLVAGTVAVADNVVYVAAQEHALRALQLDTGATLWTVDTTLPVRSAPMVIGSLLLVAVGANSLLCLNRQNGGEYWEFKSEDVFANYWPTQGQPAVASLAGGLVFTALGASTEFNALNLSTGRKVWEQNVDSHVVGSPVYDAQLGMVFVATWAGHVYALDEHSGSIRWSFALSHAGSVGTGFATGPALAQNTLFLGDYQGNVLALNAGTGHMRWNYKNTSAIVGTPVVRLTNGNVAADVFVASVNGTLITLNGANGQLKWHVYLGELRATPALSQDTLFVGSVGAHGLFALR